MTQNDKRDNQVRMPEEQVIALAFQVLEEIAREKKVKSNLVVRKVLVTNNVDGRADTVRCKVFRI